MYWVVVDWIGWGLWRLLIGVGGRIDSIRCAIKSALILKPMPHNIPTYTQSRTHDHTHHQKKTTTGGFEVAEMAHRSLVARVKETLLGLPRHLLFDDRIVRVVVVCYVVECLLNEFRGF